MADAAINQPDQSLKSAAAPPPPTADDIAHVRDMVRASGSSFYWAMRVLPQARRDAIFAVYAFCRAVDDIADGDAHVDDPKAALLEWRHEIDRIYEGRPTNAIARTLAAAIADYDLQAGDLRAVIDGMETDAFGPVCAPTMDELLIYCDRVACAVGRLCVPIFGEPGPKGAKTADALGLALQLTNILRDIEEDAGMGRLYLPAELLDAHGIASRVPAEVLHHPNLKPVCRALAIRAANAFAEAEQAIAQCDHQAMRPAIIMMMVYRRILDQLIAEDWAHVPRTKPLSKWQKITGKIKKLGTALYYAAVTR